MSVTVIPEAVSLGMDRDTATDGSAPSFSAPTAPVSFAVIRPANLPFRDGDLAESIRSRSRGSVVME